MTTGDQLAEAGDRRQRAEDRSCAPRGSGAEAEFSNQAHAKTNPTSDLGPPSSVLRSQIPNVALLTGGDDKPYALGLASALVSQGVLLDFIGSNAVDGPVLHSTPQIKFLNLRGDQRTDASFLRKVFRVLAYYARLIRYAATAERRIFHILWNNKFEFFDCTLLMLYYKLLGKKIVFTAHLVNMGKRDSNDSFLNRFSLKSQYGLSDHIFVHTQKMKRELVSDFDVGEEKITVIPFGINNAVPTTDLTTVEAKRLLGVKSSDKVMLVFGHIAPYKGLEYLVAAMVGLAKQSRDYRLIIAGKPKPKGGEDYWRGIRQTISSSGIGDRIIQRIEYIDERTELYFKAADVFVLPYKYTSQSGVLFLGYSFGLPVIAADVGSLKDEIIEGQTGFVFEAENPVDLSRAIRTYFASELYRNLDRNRQIIRDYANERHSWTKVGEMTRKRIFDLVDHMIRMTQSTRERATSVSDAPPRLTPDSSPSESRGKFWRNIEAEGTMDTFIQGAAGCCCGPSALGIDPVPLHLPVSSGNPSCGCEVSRC